MKPKIRYLLPVVLLLLFALGACTAKAETLTGMVGEVTKDGFRLYTGEGSVIAVFADGIEWNAEKLPETGDVVTVETVGPAESGAVFVKTVTLYTLRGTVSEVAAGKEPYLLLLPETGADPVRVDLGEILPESVTAGLPVTVYYNGMMTRSVPPRINALYVRGTVLNGTVTDVGENGELTVLTKEGETAVILCSEKTLLLTEPLTGKEVAVSVSPAVRLSLPAQYEAQDILPVEEAGSETVTEF